MEKFVYFLTCLTLCLVAANALNCYHCTAKDMDACKEQRKNQTCPAPSPYNKPICLAKETFDTRTKETMILLKCSEVAVQVDVDGDDFNIEACKTVGALQVKECTVCDKDFCNSAIRLNLSLIGFLIVPCIILFTKYLY